MFTVKKENNHFGSPLEAILYPALLVILMWVVFWAERVSGYDLVRFGLRPQVWESWKGVLFMPLLHAPNDFSHIVNNSFPIFLLFATLIYYYREIAFKVFFISWLVTGLGVWVFATGSAYHIGMSGVIYALFGFLFISGFFRHYRPLQAISLFVVLMYGSMVWGIFPQKAAVSWEGHLSGLFIGVMLAILYRKKGPQGPKYQYEIEQELGIEPPDLEGIYHARLAAIEAQRLAMEEHFRQQTEAYQVVYHIRPKTPEQPTEGEKPPGGNAIE
jgi:membrane associated rhomboid family serine protease